MTNTCNFGGSCWLTCAGIFVVWWLLASGLLFLTWNKVIGGLFKTKPAKYWHALLLIATICCLCLPRAYVKMSECHRKSPCCLKHCDRDGEKGDKEDCPYSKNKGASGEAQKHE